MTETLEILLNAWQEGLNRLHQVKPREMLIGEMSRASSILRDILNESFDSVTTDDKEIFSEVKAYIKKIAPDKEKIVKQYNGKAKIFEAFGN